MNSLKREKGDTKEFRWLVLCSFGKERRETQKEFRKLVLVKFFLAKGEERHKRIQAVSPLFFWKREKSNTKRIQAVSPWRILFGKGRRKTQKEFRWLVLGEFFLAKGEEKKKD